MPVVAKTNSLDYLDLWWKHNIDKHNLTEAIYMVNIERAFDLVVEFVEWYNKEIEVK